MVKKKLKITKITKNGNGVDVMLSNRRSHWISNDSWETKKELKELVLQAEGFFTKKKTAEEIETAKELEGKNLE